MSDTRAPLPMHVPQRSNSEGKVVFLLLLCSTHRASEKMANIETDAQGIGFLLLKKVDECHLREFELGNIRM